MVEIAISAHGQRSVQKTFPQMWKIKITKKTKQNCDGDRLFIFCFTQNPFVDDDGCRYG